MASRRGLEPQAMLRAINIATENVDQRTRRELKQRQASASLVGNTKDQIQCSIAIHGQHSIAIRCIHQIKSLDLPAH